jgi:hypothetical protein
MRVRAYRSIVYSPTRQGFPAGFLVSSPHKVRRNDGSKIHLAERKSISEELKALGKAILMKRVSLWQPNVLFFGVDRPLQTLLLLIYFTYSFFYISVSGHA